MQTRSECIMKALTNSLTQTKATKSEYVAIRVFRQFFFIKNCKR